MVTGKKKPEGKVDYTSGSTRLMRDNAEKELARSPVISPDLAGQTPEELIHELRVHKIELEMQAEELRRTQIEQEVSRNRYLDLYEFAPIGYLTLTDKGLITNVNLTGATLLGMERSNLLRTPLSKCIAEKDSGQWYQYFTNVLKQDNKQTCTFLIRRGDGSTFPARLESIRLTGKSDGTTTIRVVISDITEIWRAEEEIKRSFERFKAVMDGLDALVYVVDMKTYDLLFINKYGKDIWGEIEGLTCWKTIQSGQSGPCPFCTNDKLVDRNGNPTGVYHWEFQNTVTRKWYDCRDSAIRWLDGQLVRLEIATDITERKQAENTIALTTRKLTLMNDVTYQYIQNKITALRGYAELSKDVKTKAERLSFIEKEEHILADIHQLIKNSKEYQAMGLIQPQWIPVEQSIRMAVSLVSPKPGISVETALHGLELYTDPLIEKIFANLIENAVIHGKTTRHITFSCKEMVDGLILICEDDGVGISSEVKAHLFDRSVGENIHFGLFFVRECLVLSGMTITENGTPGKGARFEITVTKGTYQFKGGDHKN